MAKLRKMLGDADSDICRALMELIATQSHALIVKWAVDYAAERYLPVFEKLRPEQKAPGSAVEALRGYSGGGMKPAALKPVLADARKLAAAEKDPVAQAAARAVSTACAAVSTPTNAFGFLLYGAAAVAYDGFGTKNVPEVYDEAAQNELKRAYMSLKAVAVENEPDPVKINWNC